MTQLHALYVALQVFFGCALFYSCFCRLTKTNEDTEREIRWAIWLEGLTGLLVAGAPFLPAMVHEFSGTGPFQWAQGDTPLWVYLLLLVSATLVQLATARYWRFNAPADFQTRGFTS